MIEIFFKTFRSTQFERIDQFRVGSWVSLTDATVDDLQQIEELTRLSFADLKDALDKYEIPRIEHQEDNILIFARHPSEEEAGLYTTTLTIILTKTYVITISPKHSEVIEKILKHNYLDLGTTQKSKLLFHILLRITQDFNTSIKRVRHKVLEQEKEIRNVDSEAIIALTKNEEILNQYLTSLVPIRNVLEAVSSGRYVYLYEKDYDLLQDLSIGIKQSEDFCRVNIKSIRSLRDSYQIIFTNDVNKTIKRLTAITIIFTIPTIIASIYGMNVGLPIEKNPYAFFVILAATVLISLISVIVFLKKRWL